MEPPRHDHRNVAIDCLRGFCILVVVCEHGLFRLPETPPWILAIINKGYFAVVVFFVVSGFLIMSNTLRRYGQPSRINIGQFYLMRLARILPCLLLFITIMVLAAYSTSRLFHQADKTKLWQSVGAALTLQYNVRYPLLNVRGLEPWAPLWSLSIEEMFYLAFPLVCLVTRWRTVLALVFAGLISHGAQWRDHHGIFSFWGAADLLALGCLTAMVTDSCRRWLQPFGVVLLLAGSALMAYIFLEVPLANHIFRTPTMLGLGAALFLMGAAAVAPREARFALPVASLGRISYEVYVFHVALIMVLTEPVLARFRPWGYPFYTTYMFASAAMLVLICGICYLLARCVTEPLNKGIRRWTGATRPAGQVQPAKAWPVVAQLPASFREWTNRVMRGSR